MRTGVKILIFLGVLLPLVIGGLANFTPKEQVLFDYSRQSRQAYLGGDLVSEAEALQHILEYQPWRASLWQRLGRLRLTLGRNEDALSAFQEGKRNGGLDAQGSIWMADALITLGMSEPARQLLDSIGNAKDVQLYLQAISLQRKINDLSGARINLDKAFVLDPTHVEINYQLGLILATEEPDKALEHLVIASRAPERTQLVENLTDLINQTELIAGTSERLIYIGQVMLQAGELAAAVNAFSNATKIDEQNATAWALLAESQQRLGLNGFDSLERARTLAPEDELVNGLLGVYYQRQSKAEVALVYFKKAIEANAKTPVWEIETANTLASMGELEKAREHYDKAIQIDDQEWTSWRALAVFCVTHNYEIDTTGISAARQALVLYPDSPALLDLMGTLLMAVGDLDSAERFFREADRLDPEQAAILIHLGQLFLQRGDKQRAFSYLHLAAETAQEARLRDMALRILRENGGE